jgi:acylphosphatase
MVLPFLCRSEVLGRPRSQGGANGGVVVFALNCPLRSGFSPVGKPCPVIRNSDPLQKTFASPPRLWLHARVPPSNVNTDRRRLAVFYSGRVQGVGFRYTVKTVATGFEISGTIRNLADGRVALVAEGLRAELESFRAAILDAGLAGFVRDEQVSWADAKNEFRGFEIVR